jgi:outer membrane biosynthesis protein TonB
MIPGGARLIVGGTINLGNYENLKVELEAQIRTESETDELIAAFAQVLAKFGREDLEIGARVDAWCNRVLGGGPPAAPTPVEAPPAPVKETPAEPKPEQPPAPDKSTKQQPSAPAKKDPHVPSSSEKEKAAPGQNKPKKEETMAANGALCETCGKALTAAEEKTSRLFVSRNLCKACIQAL